MTGSKSGKGYISKFYLQSINLHPDLSQSTYSIDIYSSNFDIINENGIQIGIAISNSGINPITPTPQSITYQLSSANSFNIHANLSTQIYSSLLENSYVEILPSLTWDSLEIATYSLANYNGGIIPSWIGINATSGLLKISTPNAGNSSSFYINFQVASIPNPLQNSSPSR